MKIKSSRSLVDEALTQIKTISPQDALERINNNTNYVTNDMLEDEYHYNKLGYKIVGEKLEKFLDEL